MGRKNALYRSCDHSEEMNESPFLRLYLCFCGCVKVFLGFFILDFFIFSFDFCSNQELMVTYVGQFLNFVLPELFFHRDFSIFPVDSPSIFSVISKLSSVHNSRMHYNTHTQALPPCIAHSHSQRNSPAWLLALTKTVYGKSQQVATVHFSPIPFPSALFLL